MELLAGEEWIWVPGWDQNSPGLLTREPSSSRQAIRGLNGSYRLIFVASHEDGLEARDLTEIVARQFGDPVRCGWPEDPNVGRIAWTKGGHILAAAEIVSHSNCDSFGTFVAYEVDPVAGKVLASYNQLKAKKKFWTLLGSELRNAPDGCIRDPRSCYVSSNHEERQ